MSNKLWIDIKLPLICLLTPYFVNNLCLSVTEIQIMSVFLLSVLFLIIPQTTISEPVFETIPLRFDLIIRRLSDSYQRHPDLIADLIDAPSATIRPEEILSRRLSLNNQTSACERDIGILIEAASQRQTWALKVLDAWGKPLPSGLLKGNTFWLGDYNECINKLYQPQNKSFVSQPFNTQYCTL